MSSDQQPLRFNRPLRSVRTATNAPRLDSAERLKFAEERRRMEQRERELDRREEALEARESELERQQRELDERLQKLGGLIGSVQQERAEILEASEEEIVSFSLSITEKVLQHEIENGRYKIGQVVRSALRAVREKGSLVIRVNPADLETTQKAVQQLGQAYGRTRITTVPDDSIPLASCCIETDSGKIFSEIPGRLEKIEKSLLKENGKANGI